MKAKSLMVLRVMINHFHGGKHEMLSCLPEDEQEGVNGLELEEGNISIVTRQPWQKVDKIHYSWFLEPIKKISDNLVPFVVASLPESHRSKVAKHLGLSDLPEDLSDPIKHLLLDRLYDHMPIKGMLPLGLIQAQPLVELLDLSKSQLLDLIDCLGIFDVAGELKQVVDRQQLAKLCDSLSKLQQGFLKEVIHDKDRWSPSKLGLDQWGGDIPRLRKALHVRGLMRLAKALKDHDDDFMAHLFRRIDTGRAAQIQKYRTQDETDQAVYNLGAEVKKAIHYIKNL
ncbi:MAG: hypothetical protein K940chlam3_01277 [Chlamydiae bacterium]|nr:hypothetical protein [Chlamydiota bacterium]